MKEKGFWSGACRTNCFRLYQHLICCGIIAFLCNTCRLMSLFVYAGSAQFAMIALIAVQASGVHCHDGL